MPISTFFSSAISAAPLNSSWFSERSNKSSAGAAPTTATNPKEGRMNEMLFMLNSIGSIYSVPYLLFQKGYDYSEIAGQLNLPVGTVKSRVFTARVKMKNMIAARKAA